MKKFSFVKNSKIFFGIVALMIVVGVISFFVRGFNLDIDFVGGTEIAYKFDTAITKDVENDVTELAKGTIGDKFSRVSVSDDTITIRTLVTGNTNNEDVIKEAVSAAVLADEQFAGVTYDEARSIGAELIFVKPEAEVPEEGAEEEAETTVEWTEEEIDAVKAFVDSNNGFNAEASSDGAELTVKFEASNEVGEMRNAIGEAIIAKYPNATWDSVNTVSANVSSSLKRSAIIATVLAVVLMLIYIAIRFQISSAFAAIICLTHDLFIMLVAYSIFQIPVNSTIIAALLTILGYSINATIIIFDRIRENEAKMGSGVPFDVKVDSGIRSTLTRSLNTTLTTLFTIGMIYILGVTSIKNFALPLIVGIIAGLFSSVCLAGPIWNLLKKVGKKK